MSERMLAAARREEDQGETSLRPQTLGEFIGQPKVAVALGEGGLRNAESLSWHRFNWLRAKHIGSPNSI